MALDVHEIAKTINSETKNCSKPVWNTVKTTVKSNAVSDWSDKDFISYFSRMFYRKTGREYVIHWASDLNHIKRMKSSFAKSGYNSRVLLKDFMDWVDANSDTISKRKPNFVLSDLSEFVNIFLSSQSPEHVSAPYDPLFIGKFKAKLTAKATVIELLEAYGVPVFSSYLINRHKMKDEAVLGMVAKALDVLQTAGKREVLLSIARQSINLSPYPEGFKGLGWRRQYAKVWNEFQKEKWWRDSDYDGESAKHYDSLI